MNAQGVYSEIMLAGFDEKKIIGVPTLFQTIFNSALGRTIFAGSSTKLDQDIIRGNESIAKLKIRGTSAEIVGKNIKSNVTGKFTAESKEFPLVEEPDFFTADQLNNRVAGENPFEPYSKEERAALIASNLHNESIRKIIRKMELLAAESFRTGETKRN